MTPSICFTGCHALYRTLLPLNAASPWFDSTDSRFACSRLNRFSSYPDNGPMPWVENWQAFQRLFRRLSYTSMIDSMKDLHWDIRPSPVFRYRRGAGDGYAADDRPGGEYRRIYPDASLLAVKRTAV